MVLPTVKTKAAENVNPKLLIIYGKPKSGKTTLMAALEDNLIIDFEKSNYLPFIAIYTNYNIIMQVPETF